MFVYVFERNWSNPRGVNDVARGGVAFLAFFGLKNKCVVVFNVFEKGIEHLFCAL